MYLCVSPYAVQTAGRACVGSLVVLFSRMSYSGVGSARSPWSLIPTTPRNSGWDTFRLVTHVVQVRAVPRVSTSAGMAPLPKPRPRSLVAPVTAAAIGATIAPVIPAQ